MNSLFKGKNLLLLAGALILAILAYIQYSVKVQKQKIQDAGNIELERRKKENLKYFGKVYTLKDAAAPATKAVTATAVATGTSATAKVIPFIKKFPRKTLYVVLNEGMALRLGLEESVTAASTERIRSLLNDLCLSAKLEGLDPKSCPALVQSPFKCEASIVRPAALNGLGLQTIEKPLTLNCYPKEDCLNAGTKPKQFKLDPAPVAEALNMGEVLDVIWSDARCPADPAKASGTPPLFHRVQSVFFVEK